MVRYGTGVKYGTGAVYGNTVEFVDWAMQGDVEKIFLVELSALKISDLSSINLCLSNLPFYFSDRQFIPCLSGLPTIDRKANDTLSPNNCPTWGELEFLIDPDFKPNQERTTSWGELLGDAWNFIGQPLTIRVGGPGFAYGDFIKIFDGSIGGVGEWTNNTLPLTIYDKSHDLETKIPDWGMNSVFVSESNRDKALPIMLGQCFNIKPIRMFSAETFTTGSYAGFFQPLGPLSPPGAPDYLVNKWALAGHVIYSVDDIFDNGVASLGGVFSFVQKDVSIPSKDANGAAQMWAYGSYAGGEWKREWLIEIDSTVTGSIWDSTFRWSVDKGETWVAEGIPTVNLVAYPATKTVIVSSSAMVNAGTYVGTTESVFVVEITVEGDYGSAQYMLSKDAIFVMGGVIPSGSAITLTEGQNITFVAGETVLGAPAKIPATPGDPSPGEATSSGTYTGSVTANYGLAITTGGSIGDPMAVEFSWTDNNWVTQTDNVGISDTSPILLSNGVSVAFSHPANPGDPDYDVGDAWWFNAYPAFRVGDQWTWSIMQHPFILEYGVAIQFASAFPNIDFGLYDRWTFRLISTIATSTYTEDQNLTVNLRGMVSSITGTYVDRLAHIINELPVRFAGWDANLDFDIFALFGPDGISGFYGAFDFPIGYSGDSPESILDVFDILLAGIPCYYTIGLDGKFVINELTAPSGVPVATFTEAEIMELPTFSFDSDNLYSRVFLNYNRNPNTNDKPGLEGEAGLGVGPDWADWLSKEWSSISARDSSILDIYPWAKDLGPIDTCILTWYVASSVAWYLLNLYKVRRQIATIVTDLRPFAFGLGDVVELVWPAFGMDAGVLFRVMGIESDFSSNQATLTLWR